MWSTKQYIHSVGSQKHLPPTVSYVSNQFHFLL